MNDSLSCLTPERLRQLSENELTPPQLAELEEHVTHCESCRFAIEQAAAEPEWRQEVRAALADESGPQSWSGLTDSSLEDEPHDACVAVEQFRRLLGPTDDPRMLGRIGTYEIIGILGRGGMGVVFKGFDGALNRYVAIKMLLPHLAASGAARKRFAREAQAAAAVVHDHVMAIHSVAEWQGVPYLVMPYGRGVSLQKRLNDKGPLEVREILRIGMQTAAGLAAAHAQGLVHRDVKPANILLAEDVERVTLTDFGLARAVDDASLTKSGTLAGTPQYMSPEQAQGKVVDARSDLFCLGSVLYAMCSGRPPFRADSSLGVLRLISDDEPTPVREINPEIPEWLCAIVSRLMAKRPDDRFTSANEVAELFERCLAHVQQPTAVALPSFLAQPKIESVSKRPKNLFKGVLVMFSTLAVGLVAMFVWQGATPKNETPQFVGNALQGKIRRVDTERGVAWINLGTADSVKLGMRFEVRANAPEDAKDRAPVVKGSVEVIRILDKHLSEVRILKDNSEDKLTADDNVIGVIDLKSLAAAAKQFNSDTAEVRSKLFTPPIPDLTVERLRDGFRHTANLYRRQGNRQVADVLEKIAESGLLPNEASHLIGSGAHVKDDDGGTIYRQVVPALTLPDNAAPNRTLLVVLQPLELWYRKVGPVSKDYGDQFSQEKEFVRQVPRHKLVVTCFIGEIDSKSNCSTKCFGEDGIPNQSGKMTCGFPGKVAEIEWRFLGYSGDNDVYEFTVVAPRGSPDANTTKSDVKFDGRRTPAFKDSNHVIVLDSPETKAQAPTPKQPAEAQPKTTNAAPDLELLMDKELRYRTKANPEWKPVPLAGVGKLLSDGQTVFIHVDENVPYNLVREIIKISSQRKDVTVTVVQSLPKTRPQAQLEDEKEQSPQAKAEKASALRVREERLKANDGAAAKELVGKWKLNLPVGVEHNVSFSQRADGCLVLDAEKPINLRGVYALSNGKLGLAERIADDTDELLFELSQDGSFRLTRCRLDAGSYPGATLTRVSQANAKGRDDQ